MSKNYRIPLLAYTDFHFLESEIHLYRETIERKR